MSTDKHSVLLEFDPKRKKSGYSNGPRDLIAQRIDVGTQLVSGDRSVNDPLDLQNPPGRDSALLPFRNGVGAHAEPSREFGLGNDLEDRLESNILHIADFLHPRCSSVNHRLIDDSKPKVEHQRMVDTPQPEHYTEFSQWLDATRRSRNLTKAAMAEIGGATAQAASKWFKGKGLKPDHLRKFANWSGVEYAKLRLLLDKQEIPQLRGRSKTESLLRDPRVLRIARKLELIAGDESSLDDVEGLIDMKLTRMAKQHKQA